MKIICITQSSGRLRRTNGRCQRKQNKIWFSHKLYWEHILESKLEKVLLRKMRANNRALKSDDIVIVVVVTQQCLEPSLTKSF